MASPDSKDTTGKKKSEKLGIKIKNLLCGNPWEAEKRKIYRLGETTCKPYTLESTTIYTRTLKIQQLKNNQMKTMAKAVPLKII